MIALVNKIFETLKNYTAIFGRCLNMMSGPTLAFIIINNNYY